MERGVGLHMTERGLWRPDAMIVWKWGGGQGGKGGMWRRPES